MKRFVSVLIIILLVGSIALAGKPGEFKAGVMKEIHDGIEGNTDAVNEVVEKSEEIKSSVVELTEALENAVNVITGLTERVVALEDASGGGSEDIEERVIALESLAQGLTSSSLVGEWTCDSYSTFLLDEHGDGWVMGSEGFVASFLGGTLAFQDDGDGTYSIQLSGQDPFDVMPSNEIAENTYKVVGNILYREHHYYMWGMESDSRTAYEIERITPNKLVFRLFSGSGIVAKVVIAEKVVGQPLQ